MAGASTHMLVSRGGSLAPKRFLTDTTLLLLLLVALPPPLEPCAAAPCDTAGGAAGARFVVSAQAASVSG